MELLEKKRDHNRETGLKKLFCISGSSGIGIFHETDF